MKYPRKLENAVNKIAKSHRRIGRKLYPFDEKVGDAKLYILKTDGSTKPFHILGTISSFLMFDDDSGFRNRTFFEVATVEETFGLNKNQTLREALAVATHIAITPQNQVFSIREADEVDVVYLDFTYKIGGHLTSNVFVLEDNES